MFILTHNGNDYITTKVDPNKLPINHTIKIITFIPIATTDDISLSNKYARSIGLAVSKDMDIEIIDRYMSSNHMVKDKLTGIWYLPYTNSKRKKKRAKLKKLSIMHFSAL